MPGPFPAETQACDRRADALDGDLDPMSVLQVVLQQLGGPDRGMITRLAGIASEGCRDQGVDDLGDRLSITHIFSGALPLVNLSQFCDLANPHQDSFGNGAHDLTQYRLGPSSGFGG